ncbi:MAG: hypothetical protein PVH76_00850 [Myxococcales bacterium]
MRRSRGTLRAGLWVGALWGAMLLTGAQAVAQETADDAAAREYFERGRAAFEQADYETALVYFRHAYRLSPRGELQYNIGVAADRLQREEEALAAFEHYLEETPNPTRRAEVRERIAALRQSIAEREATKQALERAKVQTIETNSAGAVDGRRMKTSAVVGASVLGAVGVAGVAAMGVGLARNGACAEAIDGRCVTQQSTTAWTWVYGGIGLAALAGSATWLGITAKRRKNAAKIELGLSPTRVFLRGSF